MGSPWLCKGVSNPFSILKPQIRIDIPVQRIAFPGKESQQSREANHRRIVSTNTWHRHRQLYAFFLTAFGKRLPHCTVQAHSTGKTYDIRARQLRRAQGLF